ncbi:ABC transporter permease [Candidatus Bathyarchaeota archaeon]|nr:ABC transporter permease [Candidatus Bathyarchaeota archaeon]
MSRVITIFSALLKSWIRSGTGVFFSFLFPVMLLLIFGTIFGGTGASTYLLHVQNLDLEDGAPTELSQALIDALNETGAFEIRSLPADINVSTYVKEQASFTAYRVLVIPEGFQRKALNKSISVRISVILDTLTQVESMYGTFMNETEQQQLQAAREILKNTTFNSENAELLFLRDEGDTTAIIVEGIIRSVIEAFNKVLIGAEDISSLSSQPLATRRLKAADYYVPGYIAAFIMANGIIGVTSTISEYMRNGIIKRLASTPLSKSTWILGNVLQQTFLSLVLTAIMVLLGWIVFGVQAIPDVYAITLIFLGSVVFCSIGMILGGVIKDVEAAAAAGNAIAFPMMFLSGAFWPIEMMPSYMQIIAKALPLYYFHDGLRAIMIYQNPAQALTAFMVLSASTILFISAAIKVTKWKEL